MRELDKKPGRIYEEDGLYVLEKVFHDLIDLIEEEPRIKKNAIEKGFVIEDSSWSIKNNPNYEIEKIIDADVWKSTKPIHYVFTIKLAI